MVRKATAIHPARQTIHTQKDQSQTTTRTKIPSAISLLHVPNKLGGDALLMKSSTMKTLGNGKKHHAFRSGETIVLKDYSKAMIGVSTIPIKSPTSSFPEKWGKLKEKERLID